MPIICGWFIEHRKQRLTFEARGKRIMVSRERIIKPETAFQLKDELAELLRLRRPR